MIRFVSSVGMWEVTRCLFWLSIELQLLYLLLWLKLSFIGLQLLSVFGFKKEFEMLRLIGS